MRISHKWLQQYVKFRLSPDDLAVQLTMRGLEVESVERPGDQYRGFVVGHVLECSKHPDAERLSVCQVDVGKEPLQIVCGAPNVAPGQKVAVGLIGATVPQSQHGTSGNPFVLSKVKLRGVESQGMICSEFELGLGSDTEGILVLDRGARVGQPLATYLGLDDVAYEIAITPNRPDLLNHIGVAREIAALTGDPMSIPKISVKESSSGISAQLKIEIQDKENCHHFAARMVRGVRVGPSPRWLQHRLRVVGLRPRNNVVDITNFVMLECGQPLHAFDYALLRGNMIIVKQAEPGSTFVTLDGKERSLPAETVMVCDGERPVSIAGVMGGANSEISDTTTDVVIESAHWKPTSIRRTSKQLGISSDASQRFERGVDPEAVEYALDRATQLIAETAGGQVLKGRVDLRTKKTSQSRVRLRPERVNAVLGTRLSRTHISRLLRRIDVRLIRETPRVLLCSAPSFRVDLDREIDLIEEVARLYGYDRIEDKTRTHIDLGQPISRVELYDAIRQYLVGLGFQEAISSSFFDRKRAELGNREPVTVLNPKTQDMSTLRTGLVPGLLEAVARNQHYGNFTLRLFEVGHVFSLDHTDRPKLVENFLEEERVCMVLSGHAAPLNWGSPAREVDIFDMKGVVVEFLDKFALDKARLISYSNSVGLAEDALSVEINGNSAGYLGSVRDDVLEAIGIKGHVFFAEIDVSMLGIVKTKRYTALPRFPKVQRDLAFVVGVDTSAGEVEKAIRENASGLLRDLEVFDVYQGEGLPEGKRSIAFSVELMSPERTLTDEEIDSELRRIIKGVELRCGASLRDTGFAR